MVQWTVHQTMTCSSSTMSLMELQSSACWKSHWHLAVVSDSWCCLCLIEIQWCFMCLLLYRAGGIYIVGLSICLDVHVYMHTCMPRWRHSQTGLLSALVSTVDSKSVHCNVQHLSTQILQWYCRLLVVCKLKCTKHTYILWSCMSSLMWKQLALKSLLQCYT